MLASQELGEDDADKRPTVQVGDPFMGKKLIEVSVELVESGLVESLQDCGAAGLASSLSEMARECGIDLRLDQVPLREEGMEPWEVMISESQERMVAVVRPQMLDDGARGLRALGAAQRRHRRGHRHRPSARALGGRGRRRDPGAPAHRRVPALPRRAGAARGAKQHLLQSPLDAPAHAEALRRAARLARTSAAASRIYRRYDHLVGSRTVRRPGLDAAVLRLRPGYRGLAVSLDGTGRMGRLDPRTGGALAVLEAARNVACTGAEPLGLTDCLNFGNPEKGEIAWELVESIEGMARGLRGAADPDRLRATSRSTTRPTGARSIRRPSSAASGCSRTCARCPARWREGDVILLAGASPVALAGSEYQARFGEVGGRPARLDLAAEAALVEFLWRAAPQCSLVHDVSHGGLAVALAKAAIHSGSAPR